MAWGAGRNVTLVTAPLVVIVRTGSEGEWMNFYKVIYAMESVGGAGRKMPEEKYVLAETVEEIVDAVKFWNSDEGWNCRSHRVDILLGKMLYGIEHQGKLMTLDMLAGKETE